MRVFVDYDGTITDLDTFDALVSEFAGSDAWQRLEDDLQAGALTLRQALAAHTRLLRCTLDEADAFVERATRFDPSFAPFVHRCEREGVPLTILSSGLGPLISRALERNGLHRVELVSNDATAHADGWTMHFRDDSELGHDKAAVLRGAHERGEYVVFAGDGNSDFEAALAADRTFAKRGRPLERFLRARNAPFEPFKTFAEIERALFDSAR